MGVPTVTSSAYRGLGRKLAVAVVTAALGMGVGVVGATAAAASTVRPAANYWELWDADIPNPQACIDEGVALLDNGTADDYKCTGGGEDYSLYIIPRNG